MYMLGYKPSANVNKVMRVRREMSEKREVTWTQGTGGVPADHVSIGANGPQLEAVPSLSRMDPSKLHHWQPLHRIRCVGLHGRKRGVSAFELAFLLPSICSLLLVAGVELKFCRPLFMEPYRRGRR